MICPKCDRFHYVPGDCPPPRSTAAPASEPRKGKPTPGKGASRTVPQVSHADIRVEVTDRTRERAGPIGGGHQQPALRTGVASGAVDLAAVEARAAHLAPKKRGRPRTVADREAQKKKRAAQSRELMRERRAKIKAEGKSK